MMTPEILPGCMLCKQNADVSTIMIPKDVYYFKNCYCGKYYVEHCDYADFLARPKGISDEDRSRLSALIKENEIKRNDPFFLQFQSSSYIPVRNTIPIDKEVLLHTWPRSTPDRLDRTICNLGRISTEAGHQINRLRNTPAITFAHSTNEADRHQKYLLEEGYIQETSGGIILTINGWRKYEELTHGASSPGNPVFVAMWFGNKSTRAEMTNIFTRAIEPAADRAGYRAERADTEEHNDFIMDVVLGSIRMAPFVVADFTGNRNGVYLEAGFARGLGLPVIHTCRDDHFKKAHFDIQQINTIKWKNPEELKEKLYNRILATVGEGPGKKP